MGQHRGGSGAITGNIVGFGGNFAHELGTAVFEMIFEFDLFRDRDPIVDNLGVAVFLLKHHIPTPGAQGDPDGIGNFVDASF